MVKNKITYTEPRTKYESWNKTLRLKFQINFLVCFSLPAYLVHALPCICSNGQLKKASERKTHVKMKNKTWWY